MKYNRREGFGLRKGVGRTLFFLGLALLGIASGTLLVFQNQNISEQAAVSIMCPGAEQCPYAKDPYHLWSCTPPDGDGTVDDRICYAAGVTATCGGATFCCPAANGAWTRDMTKCPVATPTPAPTPKGEHSALNCTDTRGWACDASDYTQPLAIHFYKDGPVSSGGTFLGSVVANSPREAGVATACGGNANHGFVFNLPASMRDGRSHSVYAYAINIGSGSGNSLLNSSPKTFIFNCSGSTPIPTPTSVATSTPSPTPTPPYCSNVRGDVNGDGHVNIIDIGILIDNYGI